MRKTVCVPRSFTISVVVMVTLCPVFIQLTPGHGQASEKPSLDWLVRLDAKDSTLENLAADLSKQTGLKIEPASYLAPRKLSVSFRGITVRKALDSLAELNDWFWDVDKSGIIKITRPKLPRIRDIAEIPKALQTTLPRDLRNFAGIAVPVSGIGKYWDRKHEYADKNGIFRIPPQVHAPQVLHEHILAAARKDGADLLNSLEPDKQKVKQIKFDDLNPKQQEQLLLVLTLSTMWSLEGEPLFYDKFKLPAYVRDLSQGYLEAHGQLLSISARTVEAGNIQTVSFGGEPIIPRTDRR